MQLYAEIVQMWGAAMLREKQTIMLPVNNHEKVRIQILVAVL
jgi:hypothetical protein